MEQFFQKMEKTFNTGDPVIRSWFLVEQTFTPFIVCGFYTIFSTVIGPAIMKNRKPYNLRKIMIVFNFFIVAVYAVTLLTTAWSLPQITWNEFCLELKIKKGEITYTLGTCAWVFYVIKYVELFDTVFFILRKKQNLITFLHVMHHTVVPLLAWVLLRTETSGFQSIPALLNSFVHVIMYTYYGLAAMGPKYRKYIWWKKYLTQLQIIQFSLIILFVTIIAPFSGCKMVSASYLIDLFFAPVFLYLFYRYYKATFLYKKMKLETNGATKRESLTNGGALKTGEAEKSMVTNGISKKEE